MHLIALCCQKSSYFFLSGLQRVYMRAVLLYFCVVATLYFVYKSY